LKRDWTIHVVVIGAAVGAVAGGLGGKAAAEAVKFDGVRPETILGLVEA